MEKRKKILIFTAIIAVLLILAVVIALLCFGNRGGTAAPEATEPTTSTEPATQGSTAPPTQGATSPTDSTDPSTPTDPTETLDPSAPTDPTQITEPSAPVSRPTAPPTQPATQATKPATKAPTQPSTPTYRPINPATQPPTSSNITQLSITTEEYSGVPLGGTLQLEYTYTGNRPLTWSSDDPNVLTVNQKGVVKGISEGMAKITVSDGKNQAAILLYVDSFVVNTPSGLVLSVGEKLQLDYKILANTGIFSWSSSDKSVLTVDGNGVVTGVGTGLASVTACAGFRRVKIYIYVVADADRTASFKFQLNAPLYDGVNKIVGNYVQFNQLNSYPISTSGRGNDIISRWQAAGQHTDPCTPDPKYPTRNYYITSSNPDVISVVNKYDGGYYDDFLYFNKPGKSVITVTSWDGYSESYTVHVKKDYDCAPGKNKLNPSEYAYYASMACYEESGQAAHQLSAYLYQYLSEDEITWERAKSTAFFTANREYQLGRELAPMVIYAGWDNSSGKHLFYIGGGGEGAGYDKVDPPAGSKTGPIRFPGSSISIMEKAGVLVEVLGHTSDGFVTYTSSDPCVIASGGFLIAQHPGTAVITATYKGQTAKMTVNVTMDPSTERVILEQDTYTVPLNDTLSLAEIKYTYNGTSELEWEFWNKDMFYIDVMGTLVPLKEGECTLWLQSVDDPSINDCCTIIITAPIDYADSTDIAFRNTGDKLRDGMVAYVGDVLMVEAYSLPADSMSGVLADSSDYSIITINYDWDYERKQSINKLTCLSAGTVTITLTSADGCVSKTYTITVKERT